jgi:hypothetical protein
MDKSVAELSSELYEKLYSLKTQTWKDKLFGEDIQARIKRFYITCSLRYYPGSCQKDRIKPGKPSGRADPAAAKIEIRCFTMTRSVI